MVPLSDFFQSGSGTAKALIEADLANVLSL